MTFQKPWIACSGLCNRGDGCRRSSWWHGLWECRGAWSCLLALELRVRIHLLVVGNQYREITFYTFWMLRCLKDMTVYFTGRHRGLVIKLWSCTTNDKFGSFRALLCAPVMCSLVIGGDKDRGFGDGECWSSRSWSFQASVFLLQPLRCHDNMYS
jgi:hypothetical protein